ncbi:MAG: amidohydrolase family protein [Rhodospirillaceae bacterium]
MRMAIQLISLAVVAALVSGGASAADALYKGRIFDAHVHYSAHSWDVYTPEAAITMLDKQDVFGALVSSTPDEGTRRLAAVEQARVRVVPLFRPYHDSSDLSLWYANSDRLSESERAITGGHRDGLGEVHIHSPKALDGERIQNLVRQIAKAGLLIQPHAGFAVVERLFEIAPDIKIVWAHAGFSDPPSVIGRLMDKHKQLWADLSYREDGIIGANGLNDEWKALLVRHADRFMVGSDTWEADRWYAYPGIIEANRRWLGQLPQDAADKIAHGNAEQLFGLR